MAMFIKIALGILLCFLSIDKCSGEQNNNQNSNTHDNTVHVDTLNDFSLVPEYEFYCSNNRSTSSYSFVIAGDFKSPKDIRMHIVQSTTKKFYDLFELNEEEQLKYFGRLKKGKLKEIYKKRTFDEILEEFEICLDSASHIYNIKSLKEITLDVSDMGDYSVKITNEFKKISPQKTTKEYWLNIKRNIEKSVINSGFKECLESILKKYNIKIDTIVCDEEHFYFINKKEFLKRNIVDKELAPEEILCGLIDLKCSPLTTTQ